MTKNQIEYANLLEQRRANLSNEDLTRRRDTAAREAKIVELGEQSRHNLAQEAYQSGSLDEASRHNLALEGLQGREISLRGQTLQETQRSNRAREKLEAQRNVETTRSNLAREAETMRSNVARENETARSNLAREAETSRHNKFTEGISAADLTSQTVTREQQILETARHNRAMELKDYSTKVELNPTQSTVNPTYNVGSNNKFSTSSKNGSTSTSTNSKDNDKTKDSHFSLDLGFFKRNSTRNSKTGTKSSTIIDLWPFD